MSAVLEVEPEATQPAAARRDAPADTLADSVALMLVLLVAQRLIGFVRGTIVCAWLGKEELGHWDLALGILAMAAPLAVFGLPGSFGRYVGYYRQNGHLPTFLRRTTAVAGILTLLVVAALVVAPAWTSRQFFGHADQIPLVLAMAISLGALVAFNFLNDLYTGLRRARLASMLQFVQTLAFAALTVGAFVLGGQTAFWVVLAYGVSCLLCVCLALWILRGAWPAMPVAVEPLPHGQLWRKLLPFAACLWATNALFNLGMLLDRELIVHFSGMDEQAVFETIANYHSARLVPLLLASVGATLAGVVMPHLSHDWEAGRKREVSDRTNLLLKMQGFLLTAGGMVILLAAPLLFHVVFQGKYAAGEAVLPWTLTLCVWLGMIGLPQNYLWCAERVGLGSVALFAGLLLNIFLNLALVPRYGLQGAVWATSAANALILTLTYSFAVRSGLRFDRRILLALLLPLSLAGGKWIALASVLAVFTLGAATHWLLDADEKSKVRSVVEKFARRLKSRRQSSFD